MKRSQLLTLYNSINFDTNAGTLNFSASYFQYLYSEHFVFQYQVIPFLFLKPLNQTKLSLLIILLVVNIIYF